MIHGRQLLLAMGLLLWSVPSGADPGAALARTIAPPSLYFIENQGQIAGPARYSLHARDKTIFAGDDGVTFVLKSRAGSTFALRLEFVGARPQATPRGAGTPGPVVNLLTGGRESWRTGLPSYSRLVYKDLWPGIDLALVGEARQVKYEFHVKPGADPGQIRLRYRGADSLRLESSGELAVDTPSGTLRDQRPLSFQESNGQRAEIGTQYSLRDSEDGTFGFTLAHYDPAKPLLIDPAIFVYASYLGGAGDDRGYAIALDRFGAAYITGYTTSPEVTLPTGTGFGSTPGTDTTWNGGLDAFVAKVLPSGAGLEYVTYLGGSGDDVGSGIAVDSSGSAYVAGYTNNGTQFPVVGGPDLSFNGGGNDVFVTKLNPAGTALVYSGFIGGTGEDREPEIALDRSGNAYLSGFTYSSETTFPTGAGFGSLPGADRTYNGSGDGFVVKVRPDGTGLVYASYIGGSGEEIGYDIGVDAAGNAYVGGNTTSQENTFPDGDGIGSLPGADRTFNGGGRDAYVVKINAAGTAFSYATYIGGAGADVYVPGLAVSPEGSAWSTGRTTSAENTFPNGQGFAGIPGFDRTYNGGEDAFVVKINAAGTAFDYATYIGGSSTEEGQDIVVDSQGNAYVTGLTRSRETTFPDGDGFGEIPGPDTTYNGGNNDIFVVKLNAAGTGLAYATYMGGAGGGYYDELGSGIAVDGVGNAYVTGYTSSADNFPDENDFGGLPGFDQSYNGGPADGFLVKISAGEPPPSISVDAGGDLAILVGTLVHLNGSTGATNCAPSQSWRFIGRPAASTAAFTGANTLTPSFTPDVQGVYTAELAVSCGAGFGKDTVRIHATAGGGNQLLLNVVNPRVLTGGVLSLTAKPEGGLYTWSFSQNQSGAPPLSPAVGDLGTVHYTAGQSPGQDIIHVESGIPGMQADLVITVESNRSPEVTNLHFPRLTQGAATISATVELDVPATAARLCVDGQDCMQLNASPGGSQSFNFSVMTSSLALGAHQISAQGEGVGGWGRTSTAILNVSRRSRILLLNGYNFSGCGEHPWQWFAFPAQSQAESIPCQITRDFGVSASCPSQPNDCTPSHDVCVVTGVDGKADISEASAQLAAFIDERPWLTADGPPIIIGHSYGGQIGRYYAAHNPGKVLALVTLDTPHAGTPRARVKAFLEELANPGSRCTQECCDRALQYFLREESAGLLFEELALYEHALPTPIYALASEVRPSPLAIGATALLPPLGGSISAAVKVLYNKGDNIVPTDSQLGLGLGTCLQPAGSQQPCPDLVTSLSYFHIDREPYTESKPRFPLDNLHNEIIERPDSWRGFYCRVLAPTLSSIFSSQIVPSICGGQGGSSAGSDRSRFNINPAITTQLPAGSPESTLLSVSGQLDEDNLQELIQFSVDAGASDVAVLVATASASPNISLHSPSGQSWTAATADGKSVLYSSTPGVSGNQQVFTLRNPTPGLWSLSLDVPITGSGAHLPATGSTWVVTVSGHSSLALDVSLGDGKFLGGEAVSALAALEIGGTPVPGATVAATVLADLGIEVGSLVLADDGLHGDGASGDGIYGGSFTTGEPGSYTVVVTASGSSPLGNFDRRAEVAFSVGEEGSTINGPFVETAPDADGDGRFDSLEWSFTLALPEAGNYTCLGDLLAADGSLVTQGIATVAAAAAGDFPVTLSFSGLEIYRKAKLGPYTLANLRATVGTPEGERLSGRSTETALSSGPYWSWMSFQRDVDPKLTWIRPAVEEVVAGTSAELQWSVFDGNGATTLDLYYDTTGSGFSGTPIATDLAATQGTMSTTWDLTGLPDGVYFVYARVRNGEFSDAIYGGSIRKLRDTDEDGIPDAWESSHSLNPGSAADAYLDPDGDGLSNFDEYPNGTDPQDADSDNGGESDLSEAVNGRDGTASADDVASVTLASVSPGAGDSRGGEQVLVQGSGFQSGATVDFGGAAAPQVIFVNSTRLVVTTPAHALGTVDVTVANPGGSGSASKPGAFTFLCEFVEPPVAFSNASSAPLCSGQDLELRASGLAGATFSWTGPNGFTSGLQNPTISQAGPAASGIYTVTMQVGSCSLQATTPDLLVRARPTAVVSGSQNACPESSLSIQAALTGEAPWTLEWSDGLTQTGILTSPVTRSVSPTIDTMYSVTSISDAYCSGMASGSAAITIDGNCTMYHTLTPCRVVDTRGPDGDNGGPALAGGTTRVFPIAGLCGVPATAKAVSLNVTVTSASRPGHLRLYPEGATLPLVSTLNFVASQTRGNNAITRLGPGGTLAIFSGQAPDGTVQVIVDVTGYFE